MILCYNIMPSSPAQTIEDTAVAKFAPTIPRVDGDVFLVICHDGPGSAALRDQHLEGHLHYIEHNWERYLVCGPMRPPGKSELCGSFFLVTAGDEADARRLLDGDPYLTCGMYERIEVFASTAAAGRWQGGVIWESAEAIRAASKGN